MRLNCVQEKTLSAERSTQVPRVPKRNSETLADTFSRAQTFYFSFALAFENRGGYFDSVMREAFASKTELRQLLSAVEWIAILRENSVGNAAADRDRVNRRVLSEAAQNRELRGERIAVGRSSQSGTRIFLDSVHRVIHKRACGVTHHACRFAALGERFLSATQRRLHSVDVHRNIGE